MALATLFIERSAITTTSRCRHGLRKNSWILDQRKIENFPTTKSLLILSPLASYLQRTSGLLKKSDVQEEETLFLALEKLFEWPSRFKKVSAKTKNGLSTLEASFRTPEEAQSDDALPFSEKKARRLADLVFTGEVAGRGEQKREAHALSFRESQKKTSLFSLATHKAPAPRFCRQTIPHRPNKALRFFTLVAQGQRSRHRKPIFETANEAPRQAMGLSRLQDMGGKLKISRMLGAASARRCFQKEKSSLLDVVSPRAVASTRAEKP